MEQLSEMIRATGFYVREADFATVGDFWKNGVSFWKQYRFYYIESGAAQMMLKSLPLSLEAGNLYYIPKNSVVTATCDEFLSHHFIHFELNEVGNTLFSSLPPGDGIPAKKEDVSVFRKVTNIVNNYKRTLSTELYLNGLMQILLSRFISRVGEKFASKNTLRFFDIVKYVDENVEKKITVKELADIARLNEVYFSNSFSKVMGQPPLQYIIDKKLQHAMYLMQDPDLSIKEIAYRLNFNDELYFSRLFKRKNGISPSEFRAASSVKNDEIDRKKLQKAPPPEIFK